MGTKLDAIENMIFWYHFVLSSIFVKAYIDAPHHSIKREEKSSLNYLKTQLDYWVTLQAEQDLYE